ncbi:hypothetical protein HELRODRAFT_76209, partial [Helobdella robusta]|uniref:LRRNT domain-containing protein n=1 Tax=Helobdella robusta TaxID=6412 RepID=T1G2G8_HELRO
MTVDGTLHKFPCPENCHCNKQKFMVVCSNEKLTKIPKLSPLTRILNLDINSLDSRLPDKIFNSFQHLTKLYIEYCDISSLPLNAFQGLHALEKLSLKNNIIKYDCDELNKLQYLHNLEMLDLANNHFVDINSQCFSSLSSLKSLDVSGNPFYCSCSLPDFALWL